MASGARRGATRVRVAAPEGSDLIAVEATPLGYDASAEPRRAAAELRARLHELYGPKSALELADYPAGGTLVSLLIPLRRAQPEPVDLATAQTITGIDKLLAEARD
mgnify:CR=1 FL=1